MNEEYLQMIETALSGLNDDDIQNTRIKEQLRKLKNRSQEYRNGSFFILVVGPVKSGKSTLVNLISNNKYVSPTHFLECTVRPSIISKNKGNHDDIAQSDNTIVSYISNNVAKKVEQFDSIIDCLRGIDTIDNITEVQIDTCELNEHNIREKVELAFNAQIGNETLVTSITTDGGTLLAENVFLIDMPGFDGARANMNDPIYNVIAERADLIVFVQSSNSAVSKVANDFLTTLQRVNPQVPVCLIHNFFDSAHWHSEIEKNEQKSSQISEATRFIRNESHFNLNDADCHTINFGKVYDYRFNREKYDDRVVDLLKIENDYFEEVERQIYGSLIATRNEMRLRNCLNRTRHQKDELINMIDSEIAIMDEKLRLYNEKIQMFNQFSEDNYLIFEEIVMTYNDLPINDIDEIITGYYNQIYNEIYPDRSRNPDSVKYYTDDARKYLKKFIELCINKLNTTLDKEFWFQRLAVRINLMLTSCYNNYNTLLVANKEALLDIYQIDANAYGEEVDFAFKNTAITDQPAFDNDVFVFERNLNILIPSRGLPWTRPHSVNHICGYMNHIKQAMYIGDDITPSWLKTNVVPTMNDRINNYYDETLNDVKTRFEEERKEKETAILQRIIPDLEQFEIEYQALNSLKASLQNINI